ncbi:MAG: flippase [Actinomycetota bacterium]|nr:flippase [Actinomycetota bacterium]
MEEAPKVVYEDASKVDDHDGRVGQIARGAGVGSFGQGTGRVLGFAMQLVLARTLGPSLMGAYLLGTIIVNLANILSQLGMDNGLVRWVAHYRATGDDARVKGTIVQALVLSFALSLVLAAAVFFSSGYLATRVFDKPFLATLLKAFSFAIPFFSVMSMSLWATQGFKIVKYSAFVQQVVQPLTALVLVVVFYLLGAPIFGAVGAYVISMVLGSILGLFYLRKVFPKITDATVPSVFETRELFRVSGPMIVASFMRHLNTWTSTLVVGAFVTTGAVALYNTAARTALLASVFVIAFNGIFSPIIADLYRRGKMEDLAETYKDVSRWVFTATLVFFLAMVVLAKDVMSVFGPRFVEGWPVLVIVAGAQMFSASVGSTGRLLAMTDRQRIVMYATVGTVILNVALNVFLVPRYGIVGSAVATALAMIAINAVTLMSVKRTLGLWPYTPAYLKTILAGGVALVAAYLLRLVLPLPVGFITVLVVGAVYLTVFAVGLVALGLSPSDRKFVESGWDAVLYKLRRRGKKRRAS